MIQKYLRSVSVLAFLILFIVPAEAQLATSQKTQTRLPSTEYFYNLSAPDRKWELPDELKEISGMVKIDRNHFLAIEDLHPFLYLVRVDKKGTIEKKIPFKDTKKEKFDIEDVAIKGSTVYALWSHGEIFRIKNWNTNPDVKKYETRLDKDNNTEGLCVDPVSGNLLIASKEKSDLKDEKKSTRSVFEFDLDDKELKKKPFLLIEKKDFKKLGYEDLDFYPSAIAIQPATHDIYILSTKENKCLARYSYDGRIQSVQFIDKKLMPQPEGLYFTADNTLYISTQGRKEKPAAIYEFSSK